MGPSEFSERGVRTMDAAIIEKEALQLSEAERGVLADLRAPFPK
jgi:hypothetical protein